MYGAFESARRSVHDHKTRSHAHNVATSLIPPTSSCAHWRPPTAGRPHCRPPEGCCPNPQQGESLRPNLCLECLQVSVAEKGDAKLVSQRYCFRAGPVG
jgi:hypothetical protein